MHTMKAIFIEKSGEISFLNLPEPKPIKGEALIKMNLAGICRTDLELTKGYMQFEGIPGHEFVGEVVSINSGKSRQDKVLIGKRVVGEINCGCGKCSRCVSGLERHCPKRSTLGISDRPGALAEYLTLPISNLHIVPENVDDQEAVFTEPLAAALEIFEQTIIRPQDRVIIIGDGKLGLLLARVFQIHGCDVHVVGHSERKLSIATSWGLAASLASTLTADPAYDVVVESSGSPEGFRLALNALKPRGKLVLKSTYAGNASIDLSSLVIDEITVVGSRCGLFAPALRFLRNKLIRTDDLISAVFPFDKTLDAIEYAKQPHVLKVLLDFNEHKWIIENNPVV
jgi:threonine dehydrogenase-like Zn-dependent dehydrogenase